MDDCVRWQSPSTCAARCVGLQQLTWGTERDTASGDVFASRCRNSCFLPLFSSDAPATLWLGPQVYKGWHGGSGCCPSACATLPASFCLLREGSGALQHSRPLPAPGQGEQTPTGLPQSKPGAVLGLPPLHPTRDMLPPSCPHSPFLPFPAHPPDFRASHVLPALHGRASVPHPPSWPSTSPFASLFSFSRRHPPCPAAPASPPAPPDPQPQGSAGGVKPRACQSKQQQEEEEDSRGRSRQRAESTSSPCLAAAGWGGSPWVLNALS